MTRSALTLCVLFVAFSLIIPGHALLAGDLPIKTVHDVRYYEPATHGRIEPVRLFSLEFGSGPEQVGGAEQDTERFTDGVPTAMRVRPDGCVWILDSINTSLKLFSPAGKLMRVIDLAAVMTAPGRVAKDFAIAPHDGFYLLSPLDGMIKHVSDTGELINSIEGFHDALEINATRSGSVLVRAPALGALFRFNPQAVLEAQYKNPNLFPVEDIARLPWGISGSDGKVEVFKCTAAEPLTTTVVHTFTPKRIRQDVRYVGYRLLGEDSARRMYVELVTANNEGVVFSHSITRILPTGELGGSVEIFPYPFLAPDLPRHLTVAPDGRVFCFFIDQGTYHIGAYSFP